MRSLAAALLFTTLAAAQDSGRLLLRITGAARGAVEIPLPENLPAGAGTEFEVLPQGRVQLQVARSGDVVTVTLAYRRQDGAAAEPAGRYTLRRGEVAPAAELASLGVAPLELRLVVVQPMPVSPSLVLNRSASVVVESLVQEGPQYLLTLRNHSRQPVTGLEIYQAESHGRRSMQETARVSQPLLAPGGVHQVRLTAPDAGAPELSGLVIGAVTFGDGSCEGEPPACAELLARTLGDATERRRLADVMAAALASPGSGRLDRLRARIGALPDPDEQPLHTLLARFPELDAPRQARIAAAYRVSARNARQALLREIADFQAQPARVPAGAWLRRWVELYSN